VAAYADQTWLIIDYLVKERRLTKIASFYQDDEYGLDGQLAGKARLKQYGLEYIAEVDYKRADIDFSSQAAKLQESGAEAVSLQAVYREPPCLAERQVDKDERRDGTRRRRTAVVVPKWGGECPTCSRSWPVEW
jgi:hypothetical protein